ncbi:MAG: ankyrin repeat domain-containing protein [Gemmatimonadota bacterium]|nr:ankyrin repeat domain-containing protein [Gemmatimonadota bacterium]
MLTALGYEPGSTDDGSWNEILSTAYLAFLRDAALPPSRVLTLQGLRRLREVAQSEGVADAWAANETVPSEGSDRLHRAVIAGDIEGVQTLLSGGAPVDGRDGQGWTPLMHAANKGYVLLVEMLLRSGASPDVRAADGATALFIATMNAHPEAIALLMRAGASVSIRGPRGMTAVDVARLVYGEKKDQRPVPDDAEVHALLAGMTWAEAVKETMAGLKAKQQADPPVSRPQQGAEARDAEQEVSSAAPSTVDAEVVETALALTHEQRVSVQKALSDLGFDVGSADGLFGRRTRSAISAYQRAGNHLETGYLTQDQIDELADKAEEAAKHQADDEAFGRAKTEGTAEAYRSYLRAFPSGRRAEEARRLADEAEERARIEAKRKAEAHRLKEGCPDITGEFVLASKGHKYYLNIGWQLTPDSTTYLFRRHDLLTGPRNPQAYMVRIDKPSTLRYLDPYSLDLTMEFIFDGKCEDNKLLVETKHNYDTPGWIINHPYTVWSTYQLVDENLHVRNRLKYHPKDGGKTHEYKGIYRRTR